MHDVLGRYDEELPGRPLLAQVMAAGRRLHGDSPLSELRDYARAEIAKLPASVRGLDAPEKPFRVEISEGLQAALRAAQSRAG